MCQRKAKEGVNHLHVACMAPQGALVAEGGPGGGLGGLGGPTRVQGGCRAYHLPHLWPDEDLEYNLRLTGADSMCMRAGMREQQ